MEVFKNGSRMANKQGDMRRRLETANDEIWSREFMVIRFKSGDGGEKMNFRNDEMARNGFGSRKSGLKANKKICHKKDKIKD